MPAAAGPCRTLGEPRKTPVVELLILQPTGFCNINCSYCYLPGRDQRRRMSFKTLRLVGERILQSPYVNGRFTLVWHAGEPLTLPVAYYRHAFQIIEENKPPHLVIDHSIQTNGMLLDDEWADFIVEKNIRVGVSIDGPQRFHDAHRKTRTGKGTFEHTLRGIRRLQDRKHDFHVITVLTAQSLKAPDELFDFYVGHGIRHVCFNIEEIEGEHCASSLETTGIELAYGQFMQRIIARIKASSPQLITIRELTSALGLFLDNAPRRNWNHQVEPLAIVSIDVDGNISTFSPELLGISNVRYSDFIFGNVQENDLDNVLTNPAFLHTYRDIKVGVDLCARHCPYFDYCGGGAPGNKLFENGDFRSTETLYCRLTKKTLLDVVLDDLERALQ
jgi:uncharacterized protein